MNEIRQHRPAFFEGWENETIQFDTLEELLAIPWVKNFSAHGNFHQYSVSGNHLMAEYRGGREWWVVGTLKHDVEGLPKWYHGIYEVEIDGKPEEIAGSDVRWSCGDEICLRDNRIVKRRRE